jgi:hypothetical protein
MCIYLCREVTDCFPVYLFTFVGYVFSFCYVEYSFTSASNIHINFPDDQQEQQNVAAYKLSGPNNFAGLEDVYWNL